ncbi:tryptophan synthase subunit alpha [Mesobacillus harenae]|uniref:tryptophan synthase subunit alpha n=1 Tax=Mesobacillus harenae TaxID=2213203 RepID=UPI0015801949|nr:tryptophan synthase subunit alpha [Mesobacillus harenae]
MDVAQTTFLNKVKLHHESFITGYFVGGDPCVEDSIQFIKEAADSGLDAIEIGIPSSNPYLEGEVIKRAHARTYSSFHHEKQYLEFLERLRNEIDIPIWIMGYYHDLIETNLYKTLADSMLIDGFIIPDLPPVEGVRIKAELKNEGIIVIPVVNNGMKEEDLQLAVKDTSIIYCQIYRGKTGEDITDFQELPAFNKKLRSLTDAVLMAGFGIKSSETAEKVIKSGFDGIVVGSEIVRIVEKNNKNILIDFVRELSLVKEGRDM